MPTRFITGLVRLKALYDDEGLSTWRIELDSQGKARLSIGSSLTECQSLGAIVYRKYDTIKNDKS
ncbi:hypothetical protein [Pedobacter sp. D749]|uniref:hypothetical protein n=1 Tax=Pedobacter sp. D749 TaxID=2856523 RepID=UPI001C578207|nr:hypothetical protein [Pedobacter sp. D749]QXU44108.1 hypothetical protein KYH19_11150 [Pedobacter sp. D749]